MIEKYLPYSFVIGAFIFVSLLIFFKKLRFIKKATSAIGIVKSLESGSLSSGSEGSYRQVVEFDTEEGKTVTIKSSMMTGSYKNTVGSAVTVLYLQDKPEYGVINSFTNLWGLEFILFIISGSLIAVILAEA